MINRHVLTKKTRINRFIGSTNYIKRKYSLRIELGLGALNEYDIGIFFDYFSKLMQDSGNIRH